MRGFVDPRFIPHGRGYRRGTGGYSRRSAHFPAAGSHAAENPDVRDLFKLDLEMIQKPTFSKEVLDLEDGRLQWIHDKLAQFGRLPCRDLFVRMLYDAAEQSEIARLLFPNYKAMEEFIDERTQMFEVSRFDESHTNMLANRGFGDRVGVTRIAQYIRRNDQEGVQTRIQRLYEDLIEPEPTFPFELMIKEQFVQRDPADTSDVVPQNSSANDRELQSRFDDMYLFDSIKHRRFQGKTDFETVKSFFLFYLTKLSNIFVITDQEFISLHPSASSIPSLFLTSLHPKPVSSNKYYHDRSREFLFTNCRVTSTARNYIKVLIEDDPQFEGFFVYVLGHRVSFMGKHMNAEVGIDSRVHLRAHLTLHATQPLSAMQLYFPKDLKEARQRSLGFHGKYSIGLEEAEDHEGFRPNLNFFNGPDKTRRERMEKEEKDKIYAILQKLKWPGQKEEEGRVTKSDEDIYEFLQESGLFGSLEEMQRFYDGLN